MTPTQRKRVLSGIQPSGNLTIGNYLGALKQWVDKQDELEAFYCVVDLHAITVPYDPVELKAKTREVAALYLASGITLDKSTVFVQSHVRAHAELAWLLNCITSLGWLNRMTQFKDKSLKYGSDLINAGLLNYPILMAADILLYQAEFVPVGDDQRQHIELTRDIAQRFNTMFGETFTVPEAMIPPQGARIMGLDNPLAKMSKSEVDSQLHAIYLLDSPKSVEKKIKKAVTDLFAEIKFSDDPERAGVNNLLTIYQALTGQTKAEIEASFEGKGYGHLKNAVIEAVNEALAPLQKTYQELVGDSGYIDEVLAQGAEKACQVAERTVQVVKERMGFLPAKS